MVRYLFLILIVTMYIPCAYGATLGLTGSPICGYGYQNINGTCESPDSPSYKNCPDNFYKVSTLDATFLAPEAGTCSGTHSLFIYPDTLYPIYAGRLGVTGSPLGTGVVSTTPCPIATLSNTYHIVDDVGSNPSFAFPTNGICGNGYSKYMIGKDCKNVGTGDIADNAICGVLCPNGGADSVYTNAGVCSTYCDALGGNVRINYRSSDGRHDSYPLYKDSLTTPVLNIGFSDGSVCYGNMYSEGKSNTIRIKQGSTTYSIGN